MPVEYNIKASVNLFLMIYELLKGSKILSDHKNDIVVQTMSGDIILIGEARLAMVV